MGKWLELATYESQRKTQKHTQALAAAQQSNPAAQDSARIAQLEARVASLEARLQWAIERIQEDASTQGN